MATANRVPAKLESNALKSGDERKFALALYEPKIWEGSQEDLKKVLRYVMVLVGLRAQNFPDDFEKQILINFIMENYGGHTHAEIKLAFEMAIQRKLDLPAKEITCYENFSVAYFAGIMEAYREWAREQIKLLPASPELTRIPTAEERREIDLSYARYYLSLINKLPCKI